LPPEQSHRVQEISQDGLKGNFKINNQVVKEMEHLDGKYLTITSDDALSVEDIVLGYKQLLEVERAFRTLKTTLELRPVYHIKEE
jgi:transposase